jgi:hypothetical protein
MLLTTSYQSTIMCSMTTTKAGPFTFSELEAVTALGRGEIRECVRRGIISAPTEVGQGNHRAYSRWNLVEGVIAATLLRQIRAGYVQIMMENLRLLLGLEGIDIEEYSLSPKELYLTGRFPIRYNKDESAERLTGGNEISPQAAPLFSLTEHRQALMRGGGGFAGIVVDLQQAVQVTNASIEAL